MPRSNVDWKAIEREMIAGAKANDLAVKYGTKAKTIWVHSDKYKWPTPERIERMANEGKTALLAKKEENEKVIALAAQNLIEKGEQSSLIAAELLLELLQKAQKDPSRIKPLANVGDVSTAVTTVRKIVGMDKEKSDNTINLSLAMFGGENTGGFRVLDED